jgi:pimeloyl-ACP methyl ester carboxylesterase
VMYVHGATFPSALSIAHRLDGRSWRDELVDAGFHVWGLDFQGFGGSDPYPEMGGPPDDKTALGRAYEASLQVEDAVAFILAHERVPRISIIAHSWGTIATALFATRCPNLADRLVFFAPIAGRIKSTRPAAYPAWRLVSLKDQRDRFVEDVPPAERPVLSRQHFEEWGQLYLDTDSESRTREPASVKTPSGPWQDIAAAQMGDLAYDPASVRAPVAIIRGEWDSLVTDADAHWLFDALQNSRNRRDVKISRGTHLLHLEENRYALYREAEIFLKGRDQAAGASQEAVQRKGA